MDKSVGKGQETFQRIDEGVYEDVGGNVYEERGGKMIPTGGKSNTGRIRPKAPDMATPKPLAVPEDAAPEMDISEAKKLWDKFQEFKTAIIQAGDYDQIGDKKDLNRSGWQKLAAAFAVSIEQIEEQHDVVDGDPYWQFRVRASRGPRYVDGVGVASLSEIGKEGPLGKRVHNAVTRAYTRASKRAIADLLGGAEVSE